MAIQIGYDSKTIDLLIGNNGLEPNYMHDSDSNRADSGKTEIIIHHHLQEIALDCYFVEATYRSMLAWWSWVLRGNVFSLAFDSAKVGNTTLDGAAAAGQKVIPLTATAAFASGDVCLIRSVNRLTFEIVVIDTISAGVSVSAVDNLKFSYVSGDAFRHFDFYPSLVCLEKEFNPKKSGPYYSYVVKGIENV